MEEAREILITSIKYYLDEINADERVRKDLVEYPFPFNNIEITFIVNMDEEELRKKASLAGFSTYSERLNYNKVDDKGVLYFVCKETFKEAEEKLKECK